MGTEPDGSACIGVVLAGGRSSRMGRDKALLPWCGRPLIAHLIALLHAAGMTRVLVSGDRPEYGGIADLERQAGPVAGLAGVAKAVHGDTVLLIVPVDMPLLQATLLCRLRSERPWAACLRFAGAVLPMRLRLTLPCREVIGSLLRAGEPRQRSLRALQQSLGVEEIPLSLLEAEQLTDCNTPTTWKEAMG